ncbi:Hypothetical Protein FCC1311_028102 [Hondaea fermentalgiana]|uniref:Nucleoplasmin-like domain-containing protein n=1 Tax=Hondaea fermentalgiana TaxID=2315210 RepID=A0A2R5G8E1_9STRA|nr:Hypothetical Protein FCC1311_028102 [Hondaea fermentalgiana]|eukprot:GBG26589.1 Hypothetical Protein FCC1311_028102 [Hondaea fermentalgiana]
MAAAMDLREGGVAARRMSAKPNGELGSRQDLKLRVLGTRVQVAPRTLRLHRHQNDDDDEDDYYGDQQDLGPDEAESRQLFVHLRWDSARRGPNTVFQVLEKGSRRVLHVGEHTEAVVTGLVPTDELVLPFTLVVRVLMRRANGVIEACFDEVTHQVVAPAVLQGTCEVLVNGFDAQCNKNANRETNDVHMTDEDDVDEEIEQDEEEEEEEDLEMEMERRNLHYRHRSLAAALKAADHSVLKKLHTALHPTRKRGRLLQWCTNAPGVRIGQAHDLFLFQQQRHKVSNPRPWQLASRPAANSITNTATTIDANSTIIKPISTQKFPLQPRPRRSLAEIYIAAAVRKSQIVVPQRPPLRQGPVSKASPIRKRLTSPSS